MYSAVPEKMNHVDIASPATRQLSGSIQRIAAVNIPTSRTPSNPQRELFHSRIRTEPIIKTIAPAKTRNVAILINPLKIVLPGLYRLGGKRSFEQEAEMIRKIPAGVRPQRVSR